MPHSFKPLKEIYDGYKTFQATRRRGHGPTLGQYLEEEYGVGHAAWSRMKIIYEESLRGDQFAVELVTRVDSGDITVHEARGLMDRYKDDQALAKRLPTRVLLAKLYETVIRANAYADTIAAALRLGVQVNAAGMTDEDRADCIRQTRAASLHLKQIADTLSRATPKGNRP